MRSHKSAGERTVLCLTNANSAREVMARYAAALGAGAVQCQTHMQMQSERSSWSK